MLTPGPWMNKGECARAALSIVEVQPAALGSPRSSGISTSATCRRPWTPPTGWSRSRSRRARTWGDWSSSPPIRARRSGTPAGGGDQPALPRDHRHRTTATGRAHPLALRQSASYDHIPTGVRWCQIPPSGGRRARGSVPGRASEGVRLERTSRFGRNGSRV